MFAHAEMRDRHNQFDFDNLAIGKIRGVSREMKLMNYLHMRVM